MDKKNIQRRVDSQLLQQSFSFQSVRYHRSDNLQFHFRPCANAVEHSWASCIGVAFYILFFSELKKLDCMWRRCVMKKTQVDPCVLGRIIIFFVIVCWLHCCVFSIYFFLFHSGCYCVCDVRLVCSQVFCVRLLDKMRWCHSGYEYSLEKKGQHEKD